jgi:cytochrome c5
MKSMSGRGAMWLLATAGAAVVAFGVGQVAGQDLQMTDARGEQILNQSCSSCHELRNIETQALDSDGWNMEVTTMIQNGAKVQPEDVPGFVDYLARKHGPLPNGAGKRVMLDVCTRCHDLARIKAQPMNRDEWEVTLQSMLNEGAPLSDEDFPIILNYLARNFAPKE